MDYEIKANITTVLTFLIMPILGGLGMDSVSGSALIGLLATVIFYAIMYLNERYLSKIFTKDGYTVQKGRYECKCEEDAINQEYTTDADESIIVSDESMDEGA